MTLWNDFCLKKWISSLHRRMQKIPNPIQRASFCICQKGSYTLEAVMVIPLMARYLVTLLYFFLILNIQCAVDEALLFAGRKTAVESSVVESEEMLFLSAEAYMLYALQDNLLVERYLENGMWGIELWKSNFGGEEIILQAEYTVSLPFSFGSLSELHLTSQNRFRKWSNGRLGEETEDYVYVTPYGEVYHMNLDCRSIRISVKSATIDEIFYIRGKMGQCFYECSHCEWKTDKKERVYYTDYGTLYHKDIACSAIKRTVEKIKLEEVGERRPCSFCYGS